MLKPTIPGMKKIITSLLFVIFLLASCKPKQDNSNPSTQYPGSQLWKDQTPVYLPVTGEWTNRVEVADINGDGMVDLLFANGGNYSQPGEPESSRVFLNQGSDTPFKEVTEQIFGEEKFYARVIKVRDIDQDNIPDIIVGTTFQTQSQLYKGLGKGDFQDVTTSYLPEIKASIGDIELGDVDDDGDLDMILADWGDGSNMTNNGGRTMLWLNDGKGNFKDVTSTHMPDVLVQFSWDLEYLDYDNDFDLDIVISCKRCGGSKLFENDGKGFFVEKRAIPAYTNNYEFEAMDVNNDGFLDLATVNDGEIVDKISYSRREHLFLNKEGDRFIDATQELWPISENIGEDDNNIVFLDYDSDGDPDFLLSSLTGEDRLLVNNGQGIFNLMQPIMDGPPTPHTLSMVLADINNDKKMDIIMGQGEGEEVIEERIFMGDLIAPDTAPPIISHHQLNTIDEKEVTVVKARIHDNKSPNMPQDWSSVNLVPEGSEQIPFFWFGENLWKAEVPNSIKSEQAQICATDYSGNKNCITISLRAHANK